MRSVLRPVFVGLAVAGLSVAGAASAQACGGHHVDIRKTSWSNEFNHNFSDNFSRNFNNVITFGSLNED